MGDKCENYFLPYIMEKTTENNSYIIVCYGKSFFIANVYKIYCGDPLGWDMFVLCARDYRFRDCYDLFCCFQLFKMIHGELCCLSWGMTQTT